MQSSKRALPPSKHASEQNMSDAMPFVGPSFTAPRLHRAACLSFILLASTPIAGNAGEPSDRFAVDAVLTPISVSTDRRFTVRSEVHVTVAKDAPGPRFKVIGAARPDGNCAANPDALFRDGFELP